MLTCLFSKYSYLSKSNGNKYSFAAVTKAFAVTMLT